MLSKEEFSDVATRLAMYFSTNYKDDKWVTSSNSKEIILYKNDKIQFIFNSDGSATIFNDNSLNSEQLDEVRKYHKIINGTDSNYQNEINSKPSYYKDYNGKDLFYHLENGLMNAEMYKGFLIGNIFKYITRHGKKDKSKTIEDLKKARDYLDELINFESTDAQ